MDWRHLLILAAISFAIYTNSIPGSFVMDDHERWESTAWIEGRPLGSVIGEFFTPGRAQLYRPVPYTLHAIDYHLWGTNASGFHITNIILHALVACLVYLVGLSVLKKRAPVFIAALLFATHPIHTEAVTYIAGRTDLAMTLFALLSFLLYLKARHPFGRPGYLLYAGSLGAFILALMSKEAAVALPLILILHHFYFRPEGGRRIWRALVLPVAPYVILVIVYVGMRFAAGGGPGVNVREVGFPIQILTALRAFSDYLKALGFPANPALVLDFSWSKTFSEPGTLVPLAVTLGFLALTVWTFRAARTVSFGLAWIALSILPISNAFAVTAKPLFAERFLYLPSVGFCLALGYLASRLAPIPWFGPAGKRRALTGAAIVTAVVLAYSFLTLRRNQDWISPIVFSRKTLRQNPKSPSARMLAYCNRGAAYEELGRYADAAAEYRRAIELDVTALAAYRRLAAIYLGAGMVDDAISVCRQALTVDPRQVEPRVYLGNAYLRKGMLDEAIFQYGEAVSLNPRLTEPYAKMGVAYLRKGAPDDAISSFRKALSLDPQFSEAHANLGNAYMAKGEADRAIPEFKTALSLDPGFVEVHIDLSRAYKTKGMLGEAIAECEKALAGNPELVEAHINLAALHYHSGDYEAALRQCDKVADLGGTVDPRLLELLSPYR